MRPISSASRDRHGKSSYGAYLRRLIDDDMLVPGTILACPSAHPYTPCWSRHVGEAIDGINGSRIACALADDRLSQSLAVPRCKRHCLHRVSVDNPDNDQKLLLRQSVSFLSSFRTQAA